MENQKQMASDRAKNLEKQTLMRCKSRPKY